MLDEKAAQQQTKELVASMVIAASYCLAFFISTNAFVSQAIIDAIYIYAFIALAIWFFVWDIRKRDSVSKSTALTGQGLLARLRPLLKSSLFALAFSSIGLIGIHLALGVCVIATAKTPHNFTTTIALRPGGRGCSKGFEFADDYSGRTIHGCSDQFIPKPKNGETVEITEWVGTFGTRLIYVDRPR